MWVLPSRSRPHNVARLIRHWGDTPCWLRVDEDDPSLATYESMHFPRGWLLEVGPRVAHSVIYAEAYRKFSPDWWGVIADDVVPETKGWDTRLIEVAGRDGMAVPSGSDTTGPAPHFVLGADLVNDIGWLALPGLYRLYIDTVWVDIARDRDVFREVPDVVLSHRHFSNGRALMDAVYRKPMSKWDRITYERWRDGRDTTPGIRLVAGQSDDQDEGSPRTPDG